MYTVDVIIPTYKPDKAFEKLLKKLSSQTYKLNKIILLNTEKKYFENIDISIYNNIVVKHISKSEFDHGATRHLGATLSDADIMIFMTQDAIPYDLNLIEKLIEGFNDEDVKAVYARQLPKKDCNIIEKYTRAFNYPKESRLKSYEDINKLGIKTYFCSNVCSAYKKDIYEALGGFKKKTIFNEDMIFAAKLINSGYKIFYQADAKVIHSHNYSNMEQLRRNFDLAVSQKDNPEIFEEIKSESEGIKLVKNTIAYCFKIRKPWLVFDVIIKSGFKYIGYRLGKKYDKLPKWLIYKLTMNKDYWNN